MTEGDRHGLRSWAVRDKVFAWERRFSKADIKRFGDQAPPPDPVLAIRMADLNEKEAVLAAHPDCVFTIPHFNGYAAVLVQLSRAGVPLMRELLEDGWLACAPPAIVGELKR